MLSLGVYRKKNKIYFQTKNKTTLRWKVCHGIFVVGTYTSYYKRSIIKYFIFFDFSFFFVFMSYLCSKKNTLWLVSFAIFLFFIQLACLVANTTEQDISLMSCTILVFKQKKTVVYVIMLLTLKTLSWLWPKCFHVEYLWG